MAKRKIIERVFSEERGVGVVMHWTDGRDYLLRRRYLSERDYGRYVAVANSGKFQIGIESLDFGVAWSLRR